MRYDYTEEFVKVLLKNVGNLLQLATYKTAEDCQLCIAIVKSLNPICFRKPTESELIELLAKVKKLQPTTTTSRRAVAMAEDDLYYILRLK